ncbi:MAG: 4'-phosphopantetheinyl transferase superfamily protein [Chitinophaga sp.]|uniref:4'-phosphopantetheinyl transferase family protein n=1 Tax=Chitinophaga sp. TaxID=1869181 RepID=UPI001B18D792|nr:4'-phosphopantetheinyl transferase superfamily protein [Chitinophaga sp.]MBO9732597.1 4'-phosphopantetheinyl transferase superfamily protein [Chitinophaga sp.]
MTEWTNSHHLALTVTREGHTIPVFMAVSSLSLSALQVQLGRFLHPEERAVSKGAEQHHYLLGRHAAKLAAVDFTGVAANNIRIRPGVFGQPVLSCPGYSNLQVSITHSAGSAMAVVFPEAHPMAVDIELLDGDRFLPPLTPAEAALIAPLSYTSEEQTYLLWTAREALSKVLRTGFTTDLELFNVKSVAMNGSFMVAEFQHFLQYKAISWIAGNMACSLVVPQRSQVDMAALQTLTSQVS